MTNSVLERSDVKQFNGGNALKIHALTSLRFLAALYVVLFHTVKLPFPGVGQRFAGQFIALGFVAVSFFFLLSGYVLAIAYLRDHHPIKTTRFFVARFARVYPLFLVTLLADSPHLLVERVHENGPLLGIAKTLSNLSVHTLMLHAWVPSLALAIDNPNWSLSVEMFLYFCFPLLGVFLWKLQGARLWTATFLIFSAGQCLVWVVSQYFQWRVVQYNPILHLSTFALGILLARSQTSSGKRGAFPRNAMAYIVLAVAASVFFLVVRFAKTIPYGNLFDGILAPLFMLTIWALSSGTTYLSRLLSHRWLVVLGEASFGLYLIHFVVLHLFEKLNLISRPAMYPIYLMVCIGLSILSFYYLETPARQWLLNRFHSRSIETLELASSA
jgi:peptidoglycan/LPS O-acetylase OafA/YrhL